MTERVTSGSRWQVPKTEWNLSLVPSQRRHLTLLNAAFLFVKKPVFPSRSSRPTGESGMMR